MSLAQTSKQCMLCSNALLDLSVHFTVDLGLCFSFQALPYIYNKSQDVARMNEISFFFNEHLPTGGQRDHSQTKKTKINKDSHSMHTDTNSESAWILLMRDFIIHFPICKLEMQIRFHLRTLDECNIFDFDVSKSRRIK